MPSLWRHKLPKTRYLLFAGAVGVAGICAGVYYHQSGYYQLPKWAEQYADMMPSINTFLSQRSDSSTGKLSRADETQLQKPDFLIERLKKQLAEQQAMEQQKIAEAVEEQRKLDESISKVAVEIELKRLRDSKEPAVASDSKGDEEQKLSENEMEQKLKRAEMKHRENLERVIRTQKQIHDVETAQRIEEAVKIERNKFVKQIDTALLKLSAIEQSLKSRAAMDLENRSAKIYWMICQSLMEALAEDGGYVKVAEKGPGSKVPFKTPLKEIALLKRFTENDSFAQRICNHFPPEAIAQGVPTENGLMQHFDKVCSFKTREEAVYKLARRTAQIGEEGGSLAKYVASWLQSLVTFELSSNSYDADELIDPDRYEPYEFLARIRHFVEKKDLLNAVRVANLMKGESARIIHDWLNDAKCQLEVRMLVELLFAHSQASGIRTTY